MEQQTVAAQEGVAQEAPQQQVRTCRGCGDSIVSVGRGRPRVWCKTCKAGEPFKEWTRQQYGGERGREYQRKYREKYRARVKALEEAVRALASTTA